MLVLTLSGSLLKTGVTASAQQDISEFVERVRPAVVKIVTDKGQGSGFIITSDGSILTAYHVVKEASRIEVRLSNGSSYRATVERYDETYDRGGSDLALLRVSANGLPTVSLGDSDTVRIGHSIIVMGYPLGMGFLVGTGNISGTVDFGGGRTVFVISAPINPGNSGGPLLNDKGDVIGVVFDRADVPGIRVEGINFATPINTAKSRLGLRFTLRVPQDFSTIQAAIDAATEGATIRVSPGEYQENLIIMKSLTLQGAGREQTRIESDGQYQSVMVIARGEVTIEDLTVAGAPFGDDFTCTYPFCPDGIVVLGSPVEVNIQNVVISQLTSLG